MDKKYQVFISSTFADLQEARQKVMDTILQLHQIPAGMEMFPASDDDQMTHIKSEINRSDYYILILGHRYGSISPEGISYTETEYDYAIEQGIPVLAFIIDENVPVRPAVLDAAAVAKKKLEKFRAKAQQSKLCKYWSSPDDLAIKVSTSLAHSFIINPQMGWIRGNQAVSPQVAEELVALTRENRKLKDELEELRVIRKPSILVEINDFEVIELKYMQVSPRFLEEPKILLKKEVPNEYLEIICDKDIDDYNSTIPKEIDDVKEYNKKLDLFEKVSSTGLEFQITLINKGSIKANNIYVDLEFPSSVTVLDGVKSNYSQPTVPSLKLNPLKRAKKLYDNGVDAGILSAFGGLAGLGLTGYGLHSTNNISRHSFNSHVTSRDFYANLEDNEITVVCDSLIHTRMRAPSDSFVLIPNEAGEFEIKVSVICEEYSQPEEFIIPIIIK